MVRRKKVSVFAIILLIVAVVTTSVIISLGSGAWQNAGAYSGSTTVPPTIGSLTLSDYATRGDGKVFDGEVLANLYDIISGTSNGTYKSAYEAVQGSQSVVRGTALKSGTDVSEFMQNNAMD